MPPKVNIFEDDLIFSAFLLKRIQQPTGEIYYSFAQLRKYIDHVKDFLTENGINYDFHYGAGQPLPGTISSDYVRLINSMKLNIDKEKKIISLGNEYDEKLLNIRLTSVFPFQVLPFTKPDGYQEDLGLEPPKRSFDYEERNK